MRLDRAKFIAWLEAKPSTKIIGDSRDCNTCPISLFYRDQSGGCEVVIFNDGEKYMIDRGYSTKPLPPWASHFVFTVDGDAERRITAGRALEIMASS